MLHVPTSDGTSIRYDLEDIQNFLADCAKATRRDCLRRHLCLASFSPRSHPPLSSSFFLGTLPKSLAHGSSSRVQCLGAQPKTLNKCLIRRKNQYSLYKLSFQSHVLEVIIWVIFFLWKVYIDKYSLLEKFKEMLLHNF